MNEQIKLLAIESGNYPMEMVLKHEQQIKDLAEHLLELKQSMEFNKEKKEWVGLTDEEIEAAYIIVDGWSNCVNFIEKTLREKNSGHI